ncbi:unnamed protein product [Pedinophyceae sp. YPF-701]|nr:unnamed protein product [Pedinophyceae sp. YPF-701]
MRAPQAGIAPAAQPCSLSLSAHPRQAAPRGLAGARNLRSAVHCTASRRGIARPAEPPQDGSTAHEPPPNSQTASASRNGAFAAPPRPGDIAAERDSVSRSAGVDGRSPLAIPAAHDVHSPVAFRALIAALSVLVGAAFAPPARASAYIHPVRAARVAERDPRPQHAAAADAADHRAGVAGVAREDGGTPAPAAGGPQDADADSGDGSDRRKPSERYMQFLSKLKQKAVAAGISPELAASALDAVEPPPEPRPKPPEDAEAVEDAAVEAEGTDTEAAVTVQEKAQPEFVELLRDYIEARVPPRVTAGRGWMARMATTLQGIQDAYGVPAEVVVAVWGLESDFGENAGNWDVLESCVHIAYLSEDAGRREWFEEETVAALHILQDGHVDAASFRGSWAGAMGQAQFMPSSFRAYAVDVDGDGRADIWTSATDTLGSIANYLSAHGWRAGEPPALPAIVPPDLLAPATGGEAGGEADADETGEAARATVCRSGDVRPFHEWVSLGVVPILYNSGGHAVGMPPASAPLRLLLRGEGDTALLVGHNMSVIQAYNHSESYAAAISCLAYELAGGLEAGALGGDGADGGSGSD